MEPPLIRYVTTTDGVDIAYWRVGMGPPVVDLPALPHSHIQMEWEIPEWRRGTELMAAARTVVRYDTRGTGLSQRDIEEFSLEGMLADLDAVVDCFGGEKVTLLGWVNSCAIGIAYAARHPERVSDLLLWCPVVDGSVHRANTRLAAARKVLETDWDMFCQTVAHALLGWSEHDSASRFAELIRAGITQEALLRLVPVMHGFNVWDELPKLRCRTLVLHRPDSGLLPPGTIERVTAAIPGASLALFEGTSTAPFVGDWRAVMRTLGAFLGIDPATLQGEAPRRALRLLSMKNESLSPREREVVALVVRGLTNRQIAEELFLSEKTVGNHMGRILTKLDLRSRTELAAYAIQNGLAARSA